MLQWEVDAQGRSVADAAMDRAEEQLENQLVQHVDHVTDEFLHSDEKFAAMEAQVENAPCSDMAFGGPVPEGIGVHGNAHQDGQRG